MVMKLPWERVQLNRKAIWYQVSDSLWESRVRFDLPGIDEYLDEIGLWSKEHECGKRMAYDMWKFENEKDATMFMLRWA